MKCFLNLGADQGAAARGGEWFLALLLDAFFLLGLWMGALQLTYNFLQYYSDELCLLPKLAYNSGINHLRVGYVNVCLSIFLWQAVIFVRCSSFFFCVYYVLYIYNFDGFEVYELSHSTF